MGNQPVEGSSKGGMVWVIVAVVVVVAAAVGYWVYSRGGSEDVVVTPTDQTPVSDNTNNTPAVTPDNTPATTPDTAVTTPPATTTAPDTNTPKPDPKPATTEPKGEVKTFTVNGSSFAFSLKEIRVKKGDTVKIVFNNEEGIHDWVVDAFNARTKRITGGQSDTVTFVADKTGTFEYYCSVGSHRAMGMKGNLIVE